MDFPTRDLIPEVPDDATRVLCVMLIGSNSVELVVYYEEINRDLKRTLRYECRCNERLKSTTE